MPKPKLAQKPKDPLKILVSSAFYGAEEMLDQVYALLKGFGYEVWVSHKGTVTVYPHQTAFESCLKAVEDCDLFLSIITPRYGSGVIRTQTGHLMAMKRTWGRNYSSHCKAL